VPKILVTVTASRLYNGDDNELRTGTADEERALCVAAKLEPLHHSKTQKSLGRG
jgi:hypothetical protein